jgi:hypothetical protein
LLHFCGEACALLIHRAILFFRVNERPNFVALTAVAAPADRAPSAVAGTGYKAKAAPLARRRLD